jgi:hypothetical protein
MDKVPHAKCLRCGGAMIYDKFYGSFEQFWGWKCLICGDIVDPIIMKNRQLSKGGRGLPELRGSKQNGCYGIAQNV